MSSTAEMPTPKYNFGDYVRYKGRLSRINFIAFDHSIGEIEYYIYFVDNCKELIAYEKDLRPSFLKFKENDLVEIKDDTRYFRVVEFNEDFQEGQPIYLLEDLDGYTYLGVENEMKMITPYNPKQIDTNLGKVEFKSVVKPKLTLDQIKCLISLYFEAYCITKEKTFLNKVKRLQKKLKGE